MRPKERTVPCPCLFPRTAFAATSTMRRFAQIVATVLAVIAAWPASAQETEGKTVTPATIPQESVEVDPVAADRAIEERIRSVLSATGWYSGLGVRADEGAHTIIIKATILLPPFLCIFPSLP